MSGYMILALLAGAALPLQIGINAALARHLGSPIAAATISFALGAIFLAIYFVAGRHAWPTSSTLSSMPLWMLLGGALGAFYVGITVFAAPYLGAALLVSLVIAGQILISLALDHFGVAGFPENPLTLGRLIDAAVVLVGVVIVKQS